MTTPTKDWGRPASTIQFSIADLLIGGEHRVTPSGPAFGILPTPYRMHAAAELLRIAVAPDALGTFQLLDDTGGPVGRPIEAGRTAIVGLHREGATAQWVLRW